jgi:hypothetical protein
MFGWCWGKNIKTLLPGSVLVALKPVTVVFFVVDILEAIHRKGLVSAGKKTNLVLFLLL